MLRRLSFFNDRNMEAGRLWEENECRAEMLEIAYELENRGSRQAQAVIRVADAGIKTADEGYLLWALTCILPGSDRVRFDLEMNVSLKPRVFSQMDLISSPDMKLGHPVGGTLPSLRFRRVKW